MATKTAIAPTENPTSTSIQTGFELETPKGVTTIAKEVNIEVDDLRFEPEETVTRTRVE